jgi:hypothetical protein
LLNWWSLHAGFWLAGFKILQGLTRLVMSLAFFFCRFVANNSQQTCPVVFAKIARKVTKRELQQRLRYVLNSLLSKFLSYQRENDPVTLPRLQRRVCLGLAVLRDVEESTATSEALQPF